MSVKDLLGGGRGGLVPAGSTVSLPVAHNNLANQALAELQNYRTPDDRSRFTEIRGVDTLAGAGGWVVQGRCIDPACVRVLSEQTRLVRASTYLIAARGLDDESAAQGYLFGIPVGFQRGVVG